MTLQFSRFSLALLFSCAIFAQSDRGTVTGTVSDATGGLIPNAHIVLTNAKTGIRTETVATGTGNYTLLSLPAGEYSLTVEQSGFSKYEQTNIQVEVAVTTRIDVVMAIGSATESIRVTAESSQLRTENAEQSMTISGKQESLSLMSMATA